MLGQLNNYTGAVLPASSTFAFPLNFLERLSQSCRLRFTRRGVESIRLCSDQSSFQGQPQLSDRRSVGLHHASFVVSPGSTLIVGGPVPSAQSKADRRHCARADLVPVPRCSRVCLSLNGGDTAISCSSLNIRHSRWTSDGHVQPLQLIPARDRGHNNSL